MAKSPSGYKYSGRLHGEAGIKLKKKIIYREIRFEKSRLEVEIVFQ